MKKTLTASLFAFSGLLLSACGGSDEGPLMKPGENCMTCHVAGGQAREEVWTVAGTAYTTATDTALMGVSGISVVITDANNKQITLTSNAAGNFYTKDAVTFPISAELRRGAKVQKMSMKVSTGACASCHNQPSSGGAPGRLFVAP